MKKWIFCRLEEQKEKAEKRREKYLKSQLEREKSVLGALRQKSVFTSQMSNVMFTIMS